MEENNDQRIYDPDSNPEPEEIDGFIQDFIERKKLQNRVLQEILEKMSHTEDNLKTQSNTKNKKS